MNREFMGNGSREEILSVNSGGLADGLCCCCCHLYLCRVLEEEVVNPSIQLYRVEERLCVFPLDMDTDNGALCANEFCVAFRPLIAEQHTFEYREILFFSPHHFCPSFL